MKTVELFCASPASTAICSNMDQREMVRRALRSNEHGSSSSNSNRHHHSGLPKPPRTTTTIIPCSSQIPYSPTHYSEKNSRKKNHNTTTNKPRKSTSSDVSDQLSSTCSPVSRTSSRYLLKLNDNPIFDFLPENDNNFRSAGSNSIESPPVSKSSLLSDIIAYKASLSRLNTKELIAYQSTPTTTKDGDKFDYDSAATTARSSSTQLHNQVVELKVSIHCKGCEGKIRKHISRMEGVTSFSIDLESKKVTVVGNVTPLGVLSSVSKVKYAEFWSSPASSSSASSPGLET